MHPGLLEYTLLDLGNQLCHIRKAGAAAIYQKACVLFGHLRTADRQALQPALVDQRPGKVPLRPLKRASGAGLLQRLTAFPLTHQFPHGIPNRFFLVRTQPHGRGQHNGLRAF